MAARVAYLCDFRFFFLIFVYFLGERRPEMKGALYLLLQSAQSEKNMEVRKEEKKKEKEKKKKRKELSKKKIPIF